MWIHGSAGCGKSILSSTIVDYIQKNVVTEPRNALAYYYFDFNDTSKQNATTCLMSILAELGEQSAKLSSSIRQLYSKCNQGIRQPELRDLIDQFPSLLPAFDHVFVILDGLDECPTKDDERQILLESCETIHAQSNESLHFLVTSRRHHDIEVVIEPMTAVKPQSIEKVNNDEDISTYIKFELGRLSKRRSWWHEALSKDVENKLKQGAHGM